MAITINDLPSDVIESVLLSIRWLDDLYNIIRSSKHIYQAFNNRRSLILGSVFVSQVINLKVRAFNGKIVSRLPHSHCGPKKVSETRSIADIIIIRCKNTPSDAALLHSTLWHALIHRDPARYYDTAWGEKLMARFHAADMCEAELEVAEEMWSLLTTMIPKKGGNILTERGARAFVHKIKNLYAEQQRHDDAIQVLKTALALVSEHHDCEFVIDLVDYFRKLGRADEAVTYEREQYSKALNEPSVSGVSDNAMTWARHLIREYNLAHQSEDAIDLQKQIFTRMLNSPASNSPKNAPHLTGWARQLIRALRHAGRYEEAASVRAQVFDVLLHPTPGGGFRRQQIPTNLLLGWSRELVHDYSALNRPDHALAVEESVWQYLIGFLQQSPKDKGKAYHIRNATFALAKSYREWGETQKVFEVMSEYESVAEYHNLVYRQT